MTCLSAAALLSGRLERLATYGSRRSASFLWGLPQPRIITIKAANTAINERCIIAFSLSSNLQAIHQSGGACLAAR